MFDEFKIEKFTFCEREATIIYPCCEPNGKMLLKAEYLDAFPEFDMEMLKRGYYLINISHQTRWASDEETDIMADFVLYCAKRLDADNRCVIEGMSCGGLQGTRLAEEYPELCGVLYLDNPVLNILSMYGLGLCKEECVAAFRREIINTFRVDDSSIVNFRKSPIDKMEALIENNIPVIMLYGNGDPVVIYGENGRVLEDYYKKNNGNIKVISRSMQRHHPHGLKDPTPIIEFIENNI